MMLQMLQKLCQHAGVDVKSATQQVQGFSETINVHKLNRARKLILVLP